MIVSRKAPGGVFFALLKKIGSQEQLEAIFKKENTMRKIKKKLRNQQKKLEVLISEGRPSVFTRLGPVPQTCSDSPAKSLRTAPWVHNGSDQETVTTLREGRDLGVKKLEDESGRPVSSLKSQERDRGVPREDGEVTAMEVDEGDVVGEGEEGGGVNLERVHRAVEEFEVSSDADFSALILPD